MVNHLMLINVGGSHVNDYLKRQVSLCFKGELQISIMLNKYSVTNVSLCKLHRIMACEFTAPDDDLNVDIQI